MFIRVNLNKHTLAKFQNRFIFDKPHIIFCLFVYLFQDRVSLYSPGCPGNQKSTCLCLPSAGIKGVSHHAHHYHFYLTLLDRISKILSSKIFQHNFNYLTCNSDCYFPCLDNVYVNKTYVFISKIFLPEDLRCVEMVPQLKSICCFHSFKFGSRYPQLAVPSYL